MGLLSWLRGSIHSDCTIPEGFVGLVYPNGRKELYPLDLHPTITFPPPPMSCHTVSTPKATVRFEIRDRSVRMHVLQMDERFRCSENERTTFKASNGFLVESGGWPYIARDVDGIGLWGDVRSNDNQPEFMAFKTNTARDTWLQRAEAALREWAQNWGGFKEAPKPKRYKVLNELPQMLEGTIVEEVVCHGIRGYTAVDFNHTLPDGTPYRGLLTAHYVEGNYTWFKEVKDEADQCASCRSLTCNPPLDCCHGNKRPCSCDCGCCAPQRVTVKTITV